MTAQSTNFRGRSPTPEELQDLILIELAIRDQARMDERRCPAAQGQARQRGLNVREIATHEGWQVSPGEVDRAVQHLTARQLMSTDRTPARPGVDAVGRSSGPMDMPRRQRSRAAISQNRFARSSPMTGCSKESGR